jgi:hypothetical protein
MRLCERPESIVRGYVLNGLRHGPWQRDDLIRQGEERYGFARGAILAAAKWAGVIEKELDGELYWMRPANLFAWGNRPAHYYERRNMSQGGSAA